MLEQWVTRKLKLTAVGTGSLEESLDWLEYCNGTQNT